MVVAPVIETPRLLLTIAPPSAAPRLLAFAVDNDAHLLRWDPPRPEGYFTEAFWRRRAEQNHDELARDLSLRLSLFHRGAPNGPVLGHANFSQIVRGPFQASYLGYSLDHRYEGKGIMFEALTAAIAHAFGPLDLHRIMANYIPTNERSGRLLRRLGFVVEGYARDYLFIHDRFRDHVLTSLTNPNPTPPRR
jgi:ribosomal-protein-alanine N-acetyltransferase